MLSVNISVSAKQVIVKSVYVVPSSRKQNENARQSKIHAKNFPFFFFFFLKYSNATKSIFLLKMNNELIINYEFSYSKDTLPGLYFGSEYE